MFSEIFLVELIELKKKNEWRPKTNFNYLPIITVYSNYIHKVLENMCRMKPEHLLSNKILKLII